MELVWSKSRKVYRMFVETCAGVKVNGKEIRMNLLMSAGLWPALKIADF
ncbi:hypothetical protein L0152_23435 [bacterium]|nr:hypothetical protein [bacterium]